MKNIYWGKFITDCEGTRTYKPFTKSDLQSFIDKGECFVVQLSAGSDVREELRKR